MKKGLMFRILCVCDSEGMEINFSFFDGESETLFENETLASILEVMEMYSFKEQELTLIESTFKNIKEFENFLK